MLFNIIMWSSMLICILSMYIQMKNEAKFKKNIVIGVTLPYEAHNDEQVKGVLASFSKSLKREAIILTLISVICFLINDFTLTMFSWTILFILLLLIPYALYFKYNKIIKKIKKEKNWIIHSTNKVKVNTANILEYKKVNIVVFIIPFILCAILFFIDSKMRILHGIMAISTIMAFVSNKYLYRYKSEMIDDNIELSKALSTIRRKMWDRIWVITAYGMAMTSFIGVIIPKFPVFATILLVVFSTILAALCMFIEMHTRKVQEKLTNESGKEWYVDEDDYWIGGMFYYNPNDSHWIVNSRVGIGTTFNLARKSGKIIYGITVIILISVIIMMPAMAIVDKAPINLIVEDSQIICENGFTKYNVLIEDIESVNIINELPENMYRTGGYGGENLIKGNFTATGINNLKIIADPNTPPYILIKTIDGQSYLFGTRNSNTVNEIYKNIMMKNIS